MMHQESVPVPRTGDPRFVAWVNGLPHGKPTDDHGHIWEGPAEAAKPGKVLVTGAAGFIGFHLVRRLLERGDEVVGLDNINDYYDIGLKYARLTETGIDQKAVRDGRLVASAKHPNYRFVRMDLNDQDGLERLFADEEFERVCHLAAQAGVCYSLENPRAYVDANLVGFVNLMESCRTRAVRHLVYASSSSVYGLNPETPFSVGDETDRPASLYGATKKCNEVIAHSYSHLYGLPTTGLRFFTVYGPWGRPDMAAFIFVKAILDDKPIEIYNNGDMERDFTYVDDIIEGVVRVLDKPPSSAAFEPPFRLYNIGHGAPVRLLEFVETLEKALGRKAMKRLLPMRPGDVRVTWADTAALRQDFGYQPQTSVSAGIGRFVDWYRSYHRV